MHFALPPKMQSRGLLENGGFPWRIVITIFTKYVATLSGGVDVTAAWLSGGNLWSGKVAQNMGDGLPAAPSGILLLSRRTTQVTCLETQAAFLKAFHPRITSPSENVWHFLFVIGYSIMIASSAAALICCLGEKKKKEEEILANTKLEFWVCKLLLYCGCQWLFQTAWQFSDKFVEAV